MKSIILLILYSAGWMIAIGRAFWLISDTKISRDIYLKAFSWIVFCIPMGKLILFSVPGLLGFKISFLLWSLMALVSVVMWMSFGVVRVRYFLIIVAVMFFPIFSLIVRGELSGLLVYTADEQTDSLLARVISLAILVLLAVHTVYFSNRGHFRYLVRSFVDGIVAAACVGVFIFVCVYLGVIGVDDLAPISADTHIVDIVYRFNPGGNVNEFGLLAIYGLFLFRIGYPETTRRHSAIVMGLLYFGLFFSLTRAAWIAYAGALIVMASVGKESRKFVFLGVTIFAVLVGLIYQINDDFAQIVSSRFALEGGASGDERIEKVTAAFLSGNTPMVEMLFGHGWATNLYLHSVPLQLAYETGVVGYLFLSLLYCLIGLQLILRSKTSMSVITLPLLGCWVAFSIDSSLHHTIYHMQTWFVLGLEIFAIFEVKKNRMGVPG